jgi:hypothetical protein
MITRYAANLRPSLRRVNAKFVFSPSAGGYTNTPGVGLVNFLLARRFYFLLYGYAVQVLVGLLCKPKVGV